MAEQERGQLGLRLFHLDGEHYIEHAVAKISKVLTSDQPFAFCLDTRTIATG